MTTCPYCGFEAANMMQEVAHMEDKHHDIINERLAAIGFAPISITCPECAMTSYNPGDIKHGYCGNCHRYTSDGFPNAPLAQ